VTVTPIYCLEGTGNPRVAISQEGLRSIFAQIEADLHRSEAYRRALAGLQKASEDAAEGMQSLVKAVGREAIRLALRQVVRQYQTPTPLQVVPPPPSPLRPVALVEPSANPFDASLVPSALSVVPVDSESAGSAGDPPPSDQSQILTPLKSEPIIVNAQVNAQPAPVKAKKAVLPIDEQRQAAIEQIGQVLQRARQDKAMSLQQLHNQTWIPVHQLKALEAGQMEHLPEDIYIRGFIRRVGDALGLKGSELAASIPALDIARTVIPSWSRSQEFSEGGLRPAHLYLGYAALMVGAVGGIAWFSHQSASSGAFNPIGTDAPTSDSRSNSRSGMRVTPSTRMSESGAIAQPDIAPPEQLNF
jgi:cytoskeleton protein RodZ